MLPIDFEEANQTLGPPKGTTNVFPMRVFTDGEVCVSCWELSDEELGIIQENKKLYLSCYAGGSLPPILVAVKRPFKPDYRRQETTELLDSIFAEKANLTAYFLTNHFRVIDVDEDEFEYLASMVTKAPSLEIREQHREVFNNLIINTEKGVFCIRKNP